MTARAAGLDVAVLHDTIRLEPGHPYLALPIAFSRSSSRTCATSSPAPSWPTCAAPRRPSSPRPDAGGTTFTLVQTLARVP
ncbi:MAG TPA: hypothetical protein VK640_07440 [Actinomycetes bacterium]|nr:hypothetical protein [Actinomycetes bacterium]